MRYRPIPKSSVPLIDVCNKRFLPHLPPLSEEELQYAKRLQSLDLDSRNERRVENTCNKIGQEIFDQFKATNNSVAGKEAAEKIRNYVLYFDKDGIRRAFFLAYAWEGIGDQTWTWHGYQFIPR